MTDEKEEKVVKEPIETPKKKPVKLEVAISPEQIASRKRAHGIKVAKFLAGGEY